MWQHGLNVNVVHHADDVSEENDETYYVGAAPMFQWTLKFILIWIYLETINEIFNKSFFLQLIDTESVLMS